MSRSVQHCLALLLVLLLTPLAAAQSSLPQQVTTPDQQPAAAQAPQEPATEPDTLQGIDEGEIPSRAEIVAADLRRIETLIAHVREIAEIETALAAREAEIVALSATLDTVDPNQTSTRRVEDLRLPWFTLQNEFALWDATVRRRFDILRQERERLRDVRSVWELTQQEAVAENLAPDLYQRVDSTLADVLDVESRVRQRRNAIGALAGRLTSRHELVLDALQRIDSIAAMQRGRLIHRDAPPLWARYDDVRTQPLADEALALAREWVRALFMYFRLSPRRLGVSAVWFFLLLLAALQLRRQYRIQAPDGEGSDGISMLLARPYSVALAFALATALVILPYPSGSAADLLMLLALAPILRLGAVVLPSIRRRTLYGVAVLAVLGRIATVGPDASFSTRALVLGVGAVGFLGTGLAVIRSRERAKEKGGWLRAAHLLLSMAPVVLGVAVVANIFGWVQLAKMLTEATIASLFSALAWVVVVSVATVLVPPAIDSRLGQALPSLRRNRASVERVSIGVITLFAVAAWLEGALVRFNVWASLRELHERIASSGLSIGDLTISTGGLIGALIVMLATWLIARLVRFFLLEEVLPRFNLGRGDVQSLVTLVNYLIYGIGILMAASAMGLAGTQLAVVFGALSLGIGFGLQTIVNNFVSGLILIFERPIKVGDVVQTVDHWGKVQQIGIRASIIRSFDGAEIVIPNGDLISKEVINWTRSDQVRRAEVLVGVAYGTDPEAVLEVLLRVAEEHPKARKHPAPQAQMIRFGDSSLDFRLRCWTMIDEWFEVLSDLHVAVNRELKAAGITIPFPQRDLHVIPPPSAKDPDMPSPLEATDPEDPPK